MMQTMKGFKNTEVGMIPKDWEVTQLGRLGSFRKGRNIPKSSILEYGVSCVLYGEIYTKYNFHSEKLYSKISPEVAKTSTQINEGDVLFAGSGETAEEIGKCFTYTGKENAYAGGDVIVFTPKECDPLYLGFLLNGSEVVKQKSYLGQGSSVFHIYPSNLNKLLIPLPPTLAEQSAIASALNDTDALIQKLEQLITKKRLIKTGAMQELVKPKEGWVVKKLGNCLKQNPDYGINAAAVTYNEALPVYLRITDITEDGKYSKNNIVSVDSISSSNYILEKGDLVFARTGASVGKTYLYNPKDGKLIFAGFLIRVKVNPEILIPEYFQFFTQTSFYWNWVRSNSMRTGQPGINSNEYKDLPISLPKTIDEQKVIAKTLTEMDNEIAALEKQLEKYKMIKQGMMQVLLTGKIRLVRSA